MFVKLLGCLNNLVKFYLRVLEKKIKIFYDIEILILIFCVFFFCIKNSFLKRFYE